MHVFPDVPEVNAETMPSALPGPAAVTPALSLRAPGPREVLNLTRLLPLHPTSFAYQTE